VQAAMPAVLQRRIHVVEREALFGQDAGRQRDGRSDGLESGADAGSG
jgi:hypothetical protein